MKLLEHIRKRNSRVMLKRKRKLKLNTGFKFEIKNGQRESGAVFSGDSNSVCD